MLKLVSKEGTAIMLAAMVTMLVAMATMLVAMVTTLDGMGRSLLIC
jgi:hypothetical protein